VEVGLKVYPEDLVALVFLSRQDVCNEMVAVEEPVVPENVQDLKDRGAIVGSYQGG